MVQLSGSRTQFIQRADHFVQQVGRHMSIAGGTVDLAVTQQHLDHPDIDLVFQQVSGIGMPQTMHTDLFVEPGFGGHRLADAGQLSGG